jgi:transaldolase/glucose-6-phosphate isomerase
MAYHPRPSNKLSRAPGARGWGMSNPLIEVQQYGQSIWYDNIRRGILTSGELKAMVDHDGLLGVTSNPSIFEKAVVGSDDYDGDLRALVAKGVCEAMDIYEGLAIEDIQLAADILHPVFERTGGRDGYVSFEVSPYLAADARGTVEYARRVHAMIGRENILIKVPATPEGMPAIRTLIGEGISVNVTLLFSVEAYEACANAYMDGLEDAAKAGRDLSKIASVASFFISRIDSLVDNRLGGLLAGEEDTVRRRRIESLQGRVAVANGLVAYARYHALVASERWQALAAQGATTQRVLWASTSTKNPDYPKLKYVEELMGADTVNTIPAATFAAYREEGQPAPTLQTDWDAKLADANEVMAALAEVGVSIDDVTTELLEDGVRQFSDAFGGLLESVEKKRTALLAA